MWQIKDNIATYKGHFSMIEKISLVNEGDGFITTQNEHIYCDPIKDPMQIVTAMRELGEELKKHDMSAYTVRSCRYCGNKFPLTSKNKLFCSKNHGVYWHNLENRIVKELDKLESKFDSMPISSEINIKNVKIKYENWTNKPFYCEIALDNDDFVHCFTTDYEIEEFEKYDRFEYLYKGNERLLLFYPKTNNISIWRYLQVYILLLDK